MKRRIERTRNEWARWLAALSDLMFAKPRLGPALVPVSIAKAPPRRSPKGRAMWVSLMALSLVACAGKGGQTSAGLPSDAPEWVHRGSVVKDHIVYGVGLSVGVKNPALAQSRAGNRARNEIQKIMQTYSASLMKDYQAATTSDKGSSDEQQVEEAVKTFTQGLLGGSEIKAMWKEPGTNNLYALAELDFDKQAKVAQARAAQGSDMSEWFEANKDRAMDDLEGMMKPEPVRKPNPAEDPESDQGEPGPGEPAVSDDPGPEPTEGGPTPGWVNGDCDRDTYLCGVGGGRQREVADVNARAELARIFEAKIRSVAKSFESEAQKISSATGETWVQHSAVSQSSMVSTEKVLPMSEILKRWSDGKGQFYSLAVIERAKASRWLRDGIAKQDAIIEKAVAEGKAATEPLARLGALRRAVEAFPKREAMNADLAVIAGRGIEPKYELADLLGLLGKAQEALKMGIAVTGPGADAVEACLETAMTARGYQIETVASEDLDSKRKGEFDVIIDGLLQSESRGTVRGSVVMQATLTLKLINGKTGRTLKTIRGYEKGSRRTEASAAHTAAAKVCSRKMPQLIQEIDRAFAR